MDEGGKSARAELSAIQKDIDYLKRDLAEGQRGILRAHRRLDDMERMKLSTTIFFWVVGALLTILVTIFGSQYASLAAIQRGVIVLQTEMRHVKCQLGISEVGHGKVDEPKRP